MTVAKIAKRRKGVISLVQIDQTITSETSQPTIIGKPCANCTSPVKFLKRPGTCVRCHKQWRRDHERRPIYYSGHHLKTKVSPELRQELIERQGWSCLICGTVAARLYLDHCHVTGKVRGMLCLRCNTGLGSFGDNPLRLEAAAEYLRQC